MTKITYDSKRLSVTAQGHAGYGVEGTDIVCSSISTLMQALAMYAARAYEYEKLQTEPIINIENPYNTEVTIKVIPKYENEAREMFETIGDVFELIERTYPKHVCYEVYQ